MTLSSSNQNKIEEFKRIIPDLIIVKGADLKEVDGNMDEVILYKALAAGRDMIVEDTILVVDGAEVVDIRWKLKKALSVGSSAKWIVSLGYNDGEHIYVYRGEIDGRIIESNEPGFGFDPYFRPSGSLCSLAVLEKFGTKDHFSARLTALSNLRNNSYVSKTSIDDIPPWTGRYQNA